MVRQALGIALLCSLAPAAALQLSGTSDRRTLFKTASASAAVLVTQTKAAEAANAANASPVLVLGAGGGTGRECVRALLDRSVPVIASTRSGELPEFFATESSSLLTCVAADVTSFASLEKAIAPSAKLGGVIFAASASKKGGGATAVDRDGVVAAAECCIRAGVPRYVVVSSGTVTRPDSAVYKLLETVGKGIMSAKIAGEDEVRRRYAAPGVAKQGLGYTIIRPGGLTNEPPVGAAELELNQGDDKSGRLSRADVGSLCVESILSKDAFDATFECYNADTAKPVESVGISNILKSRDPTPYLSGRERRGSNWQALLTGLKRDASSLLGPEALARWES